MIDLRSDTVTRPTPAMRRAMAEAEVGDDVYGEDPTVNRLEETAARIIGKEAALFVPSGTMGNQIAIATHAERGSEVLCPSRAHVVELEMAAMAAISGCIPRPITTPHGILTKEAVERALCAKDHGGTGITRIGLILVENTHNQAGGSVTPPDRLTAIGELARSRGLPLHMDGARIFNAAIASRAEPRALAEPFDSVMFCLSKGLCAPVGSMLAGRRGFIAEARRWRKRLGGGMRQAGVIAAAGIVALETMRERLEEDHANARFLAERLGRIDGFTVEAPPVMTNICFVAVDGPQERARRIATGTRAEGVLCNAYGDGRLRFVTHHDVSRAEVERAVGIIGAVAAATPALA